MKKLSEIQDEFEVEFPRFTGIGARHPIFETTPVYTHIKQFYDRKFRELLEQVVPEKKDVKWFEDNFFTVENAYPTFDKERDRWIAVTAKDAYNQAIDEIIDRIKKILT